jgi:hypothetical protein
VGDTGIEPVTPTVSTFSPERWLPPMALDIPEFLDLRRWLPSLAMVCFGCGVAPTWPDPARVQCTERTNHDDSQPLASAIRSPCPSTVVEMFWSHEPTWISLHVGAKQFPTLLPAGYARGPQREYPFWTATTCCLPPGRTYSPNATAPRKRVRSTSAPPTSPAMNADVGDQPRPASRRSVPMVGSARADSALVLHAGCTRRPESRSSPKAGRDERAFRSPGPRHHALTVPACTA